MSCEQCFFRAKLTGEELPPFCARCLKREYPRGQIFYEPSEGGLLCLVLSGLIQEAVFLPGGDHATTGLFGPGQLFTLPGIPAGGDESHLARCTLPSELSVWSMETMRELISRTPRLAVLMLEYWVSVALPEKNKLTAILGRGDAASSVTYVLGKLKSFGAEDLTHAQIALLCGRSRQTVTTVINRMGET